MLTSELLQNAVTLKARLLADTNLDLTGLETIDGVLTVAGDRVLAVGQTDASQNGIYVVASGAWTRATDFDSVDQMVAGVLVAVQEGTANADSLWMFATPAPIVVGTTDLSFALIGPTFGADTRVPLPNSAGTLVQALRMLTELQVNTPGAETSRTTIKMLIGGAIADCLQWVGANVLRVPDSLLFINDQDTGFIRAGTDNFGVYVGNVNTIAFTAAGIVLAASEGANLTWGATKGSVKYQSANGRVTVAPDDAQGNTQLGLNGGAALATSATHGFAAIQTCAGTPTGAPSADTGFAPLVVDTTNHKLYAYYGAAWHSLSP